MDDGQEENSKRSCFPLYQLILVVKTSIFVVTYFTSFVLKKNGVILYHKMKILAFLEVKVEDKSLEHLCF